MGSSSTAKVPLASVLLVLIICNAMLHADGHDPIACAIDCGMQLFSCATGCGASSVCCLASCISGGDLSTPAPPPTNGTSKTKPGNALCNTWPMLNKFYGDVKRGTVEAVAIISSSLSFSSGVNNVWGTIQFFQNSSTGMTQVKGIISELTPGLHGLHVHANFGGTANGCSSAGPHFNPFNKSHETAHCQNRHAGYLGNINAGPNGIAEISIKDVDVSLSGPYSILGRTIIVHVGVDTLGRGGNELSKTTGNAGGRVGCGVIRPQLLF